MAFTRKKKIGVFLLVVLIVGSVVTASLVTKGNNITEVQMSPIKKRDLLESKVTASGEVRPVKFYNLTAEVAGRVTNIYVKEGDRVKAGQELIKVDPTFQANNAASQESILRSEEQNARAAEIEWRAAENNVNSTKNSILAAKADLRRAQADLTLAEAEYNRSVDMVEAGVFSKAQFDSAKARREVALAAIESQQAHIQQLEDNLKNTESSVKRSEVTYQSTRERIGSTRAQLLNAQDQLSKTVRKSPINGVVSSLPLKEGEYVLSNFSSSSLVTIADMADVNVEVKVDETDISNVKLGQLAKVKVDALGETEIDGEVTEIGHSAVTRSGQTITQSSSSQEAKDFKVVVKLKATVETLNRLRPGMSATATITTDTRNNVLAIPMQALVIKDLEEEKKAQEKATPTDVQKVEKEPSKKREEQGVYIVKDSKAEFVAVKTGITGDTDIEVLEGLKESDQIITGPFRQLRNLKSGTAVKQETVNKANKEKDEK
ncbi:MAG: HlyD family secretion protein [bacterium]|nr:MAG: HlyD family secretion protein [bacterium]